MRLIIIEAPSWASPEWWLVAAAFLTLGVVIAQTIATAKAARAARDAASAANLTADAADRQSRTMEAQTRALIDSERAWLVLTPEKATTGESRIGWGFVSVGLDCTVRNLGKTPAQLTQLKVGLLMLNSGTSLVSLPRAPDLARTHDIHPVTEFVPGLGTEPLTIPLKCEGLRVGEFLVVYGLIRYKHVLSANEVRSTFGYSIDHNDRLEQLPSEFPEYNKTT